MWVASKLSGAAGALGAEANGAREIRVRITRRMDLWEMGQHAGLVKDAEAEGASQEGRATFSGKE